MNSLDYYILTVNPIHPFLSFFFFSCIHSFWVQVEVWMHTHLPHPRLIDISWIVTHTAYECLLGGWNFSNPSSSDLGFLVVCRQHKLWYLIAKRTRVTDQPYLPAMEQGKMDAQWFWTPLMVPKQGNWRTDEKSDPHPWVAEPSVILAWARKQDSIQGKSCQDLEEWSSLGLGSVGGVYCRRIDTWT